MVDKLPKKAVNSRYDADGGSRKNVDVAELTGVLDLTAWPAGRPG